ncbi:MAG: sigma-54-dependent Fis family transcriptional regulator [Desulfobacter sp.]|nr:MAG: sigma-54-dependent Fis family transcriptional regulator [Desulfobacter sp.]
MNKEAAGQVLVIDDDPDFCYAVNRILGRLGHGSTTVDTLASARQAVVSADFSLVLLDVGLPDGSGLDLLPELKGLPADPEVVIITGAGDARGAELAILNGAWSYIEKTASAKEISLAVSRALQYREERLKARRPDLVTSLKREQIIGSSPRMKQALDEVAKASACDAGLLITGETGTGKELFARAVHMNSRRRDHELVVVDCAALPETLGENLLFGHKKGVYTGADASRDGLIKAAHQGSLFLDEVGELPLGLQKILLRVLQEKRFRPLGQDREVFSDFRLIAATNRDLGKMAEEGRFRKDLLFRIKSLHIELPPLSDRGGDIKRLARHYLDRYCDAQAVDSKGMSSDFTEVVSAYSWPGNVRELAHAMEHVVIAAMTSPIVFSSHLPASLRAAVAKAGFTAAVAGEAGQEEGYGPGPMPSLSEYRDRMVALYEEKYLRDLLNRSADIKSACRVSGLSRSRLYALLKKYGISAK